MKIRFLPVLVSAFTSFSLLAAPISPEQALRRAFDSSPRKAFSLRGEHPSLIKTIKEENLPAIYIYSSEKASYILSADDATMPILGYSDTKFDIDNLPPAFNSWLNTISVEIGLIREGAAPGVRDNEYRNEFSKIAPLCTTQWNQDSPYNDKCPKPKWEDQRCYTGCVATAMAQVMKYHNWPRNGEGLFLYKWNGSTLRQDFENTTYDWANMLDTYPAGSYTEEEGNAVAVLMRSCGISVQMNYGTSASGALSGYVAGALGKYFRYDKSKLQYVLRDYYTLEQWEKMVYHSLKEYGPVILDGQSTAGGHSFVCDGYDTDGYFHINWGWGGISDGYYLLSALDPFNQGIGGSGDNSGFDYMQDAVLGITPAKDANGEPAANSNESWYGHIYGVGEIGLDTSQIYYEDDTVEGLCPDGMYNYGPTYLSAATALGILFEDDTTKERFISYGYLGQSIDVLYGFADISLPLPYDLPDGVYTVTLAYSDPAYKGAVSGSNVERVSPSTPNESPETQDDEEEYPEIGDDAWVNIIFPAQNVQSYKAAVKDGMIVFTPSFDRPSGLSAVVAPTREGVEYYNLQGMRIATPCPGEIIIVREKGKSYKRIF